MNLNDIYGGEYLKAADLESHWPVQVTIESTELVKHDDGKQQIALRFVGKQKKLGLNKTNAERIAYQFGSEWQTQWVGQTITLIVENVEFQGKIVPAVRVQMPQPRAPQHANPAQMLADPAPGPSQTVSSADVQEDDIPW